MSLQFNVSTLLREPTGAVRHHEIESDVVIEGSRRHVTGNTTFLRTQDGVLVTGEFGGEQTDACSRCLIEVSLPVTFSVSEEYASLVDADTGRNVAPPVDPEALRIDETNTLDLQEAVRQSWTAALPMQALCREDCSGLCAQCGHDLNDSNCACQPEADERWSGLQALAKDLKGS